MEVSLPDDFRCPISLEVMSDPVILTSGHTFDRSSIQRWLDSGNLTCPITNLPLPPHPPLIPNHALRRLISTFTSNQIPKFPDNPQSLLSSLSFPSDPQTLSTLLRIIQKDADFRRRIADSSAPKILLSHVSSSDRPELQKLAIYSVLYLSLDGDDVKVGLVAEGAVDHLVAAVKSNGAAAAAAATVITSLATVDVNKCTIGAHPSAIASLAAMLVEGHGRRERREAATAIYELCKFPENRKWAVRAGSVRPLVELTGLGLDRAVEVLGLLAKSREGREEMGRVENFVRILVVVLENGSERGVENALLVLNLVCSNDKEMGLEAKREGVLELAFKLVKDGNGKIGKNALGLVKTLQRDELREF